MLPSSLPWPTLVLLSKVLISLSMSHIYHWLCLPPPAGSLGLYVLTLTVAGHHLDCPEVESCMSVPRTSMIKLAFLRSSYNGTNEDHQLSSAVPQS